MSSQPGDKPRRVRRAERRVQYWAGKLRDADGGDDALSVAWSWTRSALADLQDRRPETAEAARWEIARSLAGVAARLPREKYELRAGLAEPEVQGLLDPWRRNDGDSR